MRITHAILVGSLMYIGSGFAADECCNCACGMQMHQQTSMSDMQRNGYFIQNGKVMVIRDGSTSEINGVATFDNGMRIQPDGVIILVDGTRQNLRDGQWLSTDGRFSERRNNDNMAMRQNMNTRDGYFIQDGKVMTFRDGHVSAVTTETTLNNGARLQADGTLIMKDGTRSTLNASQFVTIEGNISRNNTAQNVSHDRTTDQNNPNRSTNQNREHDTNHSEATPGNATNGATEGNRPTQGRDGANLNNPNSTPAPQTSTTNPQNNGSAPTQGRSETAKEGTPNNTGNPTQGRGEANKDNATK